MQEARFESDSSHGGDSSLLSQPPSPTPHTDQMDQFIMKISCSELEVPLLSATTHNSSKSNDLHSGGEGSSSGGLEEVIDRALLPKERLELLRMSVLTARGIHDAGWQRFGYWFATPEAWDRSGILRVIKSACIS